MYAMRDRLTLVQRTICRMRPTNLCVNIILTDPEIKKAAVAHTNLDDYTTASNMNVYL
jgi:hypothetical protein